jgi:hypothetical protein
MNLHVCFRMSFTTHDRCPCTTPEVSLTKRASNLPTEAATTTNQSPDDDPYLLIYFAIVQPFVCYFHQVACWILTRLVGKPRDI